MPRFPIIRWIEAGSRKGGDAISTPAPRTPVVLLLGLLVALGPIPAVADPAPTFEVAGTAGLVLAADPRGDGPEPRPGYGLRAGADPGLLPRPWFARVEALWLHVAWEDGTRAVNVATAVDTFGLPLALGYEWSGRSCADRSAGPGCWWLAPYLAAGPSLVRTGVRYHVADPVTETSDKKDLAALDPGAVYGAGARLAAGVGGGLALSLRLDVLGLRRGVADDLALAGALGVLF